MNSYYNQIQNVNNNMYMYCILQLSLTDSHAFDVSDNYEVLSFLR